MNEGKYTRRKFVKQNTKAGLGAMVAMGISPSLVALNFNDASKPAILGGTPTHAGGWTNWPIWNPETDEKKNNRSASKWRVVPCRVGNGV